MKTRILTTSALILALAVVPHSRVKAQSKPQWVVPVVCGVIVIGVGAWIGYSIYKMCQKIPPANPPPDQQQQDPPPQNQGQFTAPSTNAPGPTMQLTDASGVIYWDASAFGWQDPVSGAPITQIMSTRLQSTADFHTWAEELSLLGYCSDSGMTVIYSRNGAPICTNYLSAGTTNVLNFNQGGTLAPHKFYRLAAP